MMHMDMMGYQVILFYKQMSPHSLILTNCNEYYSKFPSPKTLFSTQALMSFKVMKGCIGETVQEHQCDESANLQQFYKNEEMTLVIYRYNAVH